MSHQQSNEELLERIRSLEAENKALRSQISTQAAEQPSAADSSSQQQQPDGTHDDWFMYANQPQKYQLSQEQIARYSRHLLLPDIGMHGQEKLCAGSVLIVGLGGLGSPCALYLAAAGIGRLGFVDFDKVDTSNLHRQVIHKECNQGMPKVESARRAIQELNAATRVELHTEGFNEQNGIDLVKQYDVIVDGSDNVSTRYLINDACVMAGKPLVSGSAVRFEGQLTVYNHLGGPCYRCMFPVPPPAETVTNCADGGVLGVVPGIIGCIQALEVQKLLMGWTEEQLLVKRMLIFNAKTSTFRTMKIRSRVPTCAVCGDNPSIQELHPYDQHCSDAPAKSTQHEQQLQEDQRVSVEQYRELLKQHDAHLLLDVRDSHQFEIANLPGAVNIPLKQLPDSLDQLRNEIIQRNGSSGQQSVEDYPIYVICRRGIASVRGTKVLAASGFRNVKNINGGVTSWHRIVDKEFPIY